jgi:hypothetical protein
MLKFAYTNNNVHLEVLPETLSEWISARVMFCVYSSNPIFVTPETASLLISADTNTFNYLDQALDQEIIEVVQVNDEDIEVILKGVWVTSNVDSEDGIFVTTMSYDTEFFLSQIFLEEQNLSYKY